MTSTSTTSNFSSSSPNLTINNGVSASALDDVTIAALIDSNDNQLPTTQCDQSAIQPSATTSSPGLSSSPPVTSTNDADDHFQAKAVVVDDQSPTDNLGKLKVKNVKVVTSKSPVEKEVRAQISIPNISTPSKPIEVKPSIVKDVSSSLMSSTPKSSPSKSSLSPSPNFPQMVFSFLPLSTAVETTLKATNFAATALSKAISTSSIVHSISSSNSSSSLESSDDQVTSVTKSQLESASQAQSTQMQSSSSSSAALPYVHLPGVLTALDQAVQEYDVLLSENGAVAFMRPNFAPKVATTEDAAADLFSDDTRLVEVRVLTKEALLSLAASPPLGYLALMEALKAGSPVPMKQLKASSFARLLNSVEAVFTKASDLVEATSASFSSGVDDTETGDPSDETRQRTSTSSSYASVIIIADDALDSMEQEMTSENGSSTTTATLEDPEVERENLNDDHTCDEQEKEKPLRKEALLGQKSSTSPKRSSSTYSTVTTKLEGSTTEKVVEEVSKVEHGKCDEEDEEERTATSLPTVVLQPPTPQPPPLSPTPSAVPIKESFLHGPRSKRFAHLSGIELLSMPAREKSASTPSLLSNASSCCSDVSSSYNSSFSNHKSSFSSVKSDTSDIEKEKGNFTTTKVLPGDDFEDIVVEDASVNVAQGKDCEDQMSIGSGNSSSSSVLFPLISAEDIRSSLAQQTGTTSASSSSTSMAPNPSGHSGHKRRPSTLIQIHNPSYKARCEDFEAIFGAHGIPPTERLIADFSCAFYKSILIQGRIYITKHFFAFYANWVGLYEKYMIIKCSDVKAVVKANTMVWIPNAIHITTVDGEKHIFASFGARDRAYEVMSTVWKAVKEGEAEKEGDEAQEDEPKEPKEVETSSSNNFVKVASSSSLTSAATSADVEGKDGPSDDNGACTDNGSGDKGDEMTVVEQVASNVAITSTSSSSTSSSTTTTGVEQCSAVTTTTTTTSFSSSSKLSNAEMWSIVKDMYGDNLGLSHHEEVELSGGAAATANSAAVEKATVSTSSLTAVAGSAEANEDENGNEIAVATVSDSTISTSTASASAISSPAKSKVRFGRDRSPKASSSCSHSEPTTKEETDMFKKRGKKTSKVTSIKDDQQKLQAAVPAPSPDPAPAPAASAPTPAVNCPCVNAHYGAIVIERTYPVSVDVLFELLFAEADPPAVPQSALFTEQFLRSRGTTDLKMTPWRLLATEGELAELAKTCKDLGIYGDLRTLFSGGESNENSGILPIKNRNLEYTIELNHVLCKSCYTRERQFILAQKAGAYYVIFSEAKNEGPPFSDSFVVCSTMCLSSAGSGQTKLSVQYKLCWIKTSLSMRMLTGTIERSSKEGFTESANHKLRRMEMHLKLIPADEHFLTTLAACSPEMAATFASGGSIVSALGSPQMTSSGTVDGATAVLNSGPSSSQTADLSSHISASTLPSTNNVLQSSEIGLGTSGQPSFSAGTVGSVLGDQTGNGSNSRFGLLANVNLLLVILILFMIAYIVLINRVWAMEERMDKMAEYIVALLKEDVAGDGGGQGGQSSARVEL